MLTTRTTFEFLPNSREEEEEKVNHFQLWRESPFVTNNWPGAEIITKLSFPFKVFEN